MIKFADDLDECLSSEDFGSTIKVGNREFAGIVSEDYVQHEVGEAGVSGTSLFLYVSETNVSELEIGVAVTVKDDVRDDEEFEIASEPETDEAGLYRMKLRAIATS